MIVFLFATLRLVHTTSAANLLRPAINSCCKELEIFPIFCSDNLALCDSHCDLRLM